MKRSEINRYQQEAAALFAAHSFHLPRWASWTPEQWQARGADCGEVKQCHLGWDLTDFGGGDFEKLGLLLFTIRNGVAGGAYHKPYAEKIMVVRDGQVTPIHFHWKKMEDIINRGGAELEMRMWRATDKEELSDAPVTLSLDGVAIEAKAGEAVLLKPGDSVTMEPYLYHTFRAVGGTALVGEVSMVNDDSADNRFLKPAGRFPKIEEDAAPLWLLCNEYP